MTSLVERLREGVSIEPTFAECRDANNLMDEAADTIEALCEALEQLDTWLTGCIDCEAFHWDGDQWQSAVWSRDNARAVLAKVQS